MKYVRPRWVEEGMTVIVPMTGVEVDPFKGLQATEAVQTLLGVKCSVTMAAGYHARVVNEKHGINRTFHIDQLRVPEGDPHA